MSSDYYPYNLIIFGQCRDLVGPLEFDHIYLLVDIHVVVPSLISQCIEITALLVDREIRGWMALSLLLRHGQF
jgi:hypothetical protein